MNIHSFQPKNRKDSSFPGTVEKLSFTENIDNSNRNEMKQKGVVSNESFPNCTIGISDQNDNEIQVAVVLAPFSS